MLWQDFCGLLAKHNTRHNEKHLFQSEQSTEPHRIQKQPRELTFYCISVTLIIFGGLGSQPWEYSHTILQETKVCQFYKCSRDVVCQWRTLQKKTKHLKGNEQKETSLQAIFITASQETGLFIAVLRWEFSPLDSSSADTRHCCRKTKWISSMFLCVNRCCPRTNETPTHCNHSCISQRTIASTCWTQDGKMINGRNSWSTIFLLLGFC